MESRIYREVHPLTPFILNNLPQNTGNGEGKGEGAD
jgi:hypothetical protein